MNQPAVLGQPIIWIETQDEILDPFIQGVDQTYRQIFDSNPKAEALWIMKPHMREPYRFSWRQSFQRKPQGKRHDSRKKRNHEARVEKIT